MSKSRSGESEKNSNTIDIVVPNDQREGNQASVHRWLKRVGDPVKRNEPILEINTDKVTLEVSAPENGVLVEILKNPKDACELGDVFGRIAPGALSESADNSSPQHVSQTKVDNRSDLPGVTVRGARLSPAVRNIAALTKIDPYSVPATGAHGRVTARDMERAQKAPPAHSGKSVSSGSEADILVPHTPMRKTIATEMAKSVSLAPHVTSVFECDFEAILSHRASHREEFANRGVRLTITPYLLRACATALKAVPEVNASWHSEHVAIHPQINIGIATAIENAQGGGAGLVVPVVKAVDQIDFFDLARQVQRFAESGRSGKLTTADLSGGTFTISNHGVSGSLFASPIIILQPQVAILGVGKLEKRVVLSADGHNFEARSKAYVTLTIDHRALDGFTANRFLTIFDQALQKPSL